MLEREFQKMLIRRIKELFPGSMVLKTDTTQRQGIPDLLVLLGDKWAALEVKRSDKACYRPNQSFYCKMLDRMGFARIIYPENGDKIMAEMSDYFLEG